MRIRFNVRGYIDHRDIPQLNAAGMLLAKRLELQDAPIVDEYRRRVRENIALRAERRPPAPVAELPALLRRQAG